MVERRNDLGVFPRKIHDLAFSFDGEQVAVLSVDFFFEERFAVAVHVDKQVPVAFGAADFDAVHLRRIAAIRIGGGGGDDSSKTGRGAKSAGVVIDEVDSDFPSRVSEGVPARDVPRGKRRAVLVDEICSRVGELSAFGVEEELDLVAEVSVLCGLTTKGCHGDAGDSGNARRLLFHSLVSGGSGANIVEKVNGRKETRRGTCFVFLYIQSIQQGKRHDSFFLFVRCKIKKSDSETGFQRHV